MTTTYQPLPITDTDLAQFQELLAGLRVTRKQTEGGEDYILVETITDVTTKLAAIRRGAETGEPPYWLLQHPRPGASGLYEFATAEELSNFLHFGNHNQYRRCFRTGGSQPGAIVEDCSGDSNIQELSEERFIGTLVYPVAGSASATLTVREREADPRVTPPDLAWRLVDDSRLLLPEDGARLMAGARESWEVVPSALKAPPRGSPALVMS
jgi:hypothetical protein